jgi:hypothetical protein
MEDQFALQDKYEASRSSITYPSPVSASRSDSLSLSGDTTTATSNTSPSSHQLLFSMIGRRTLPCSRTSGSADSGQSSEHESDSKHREFVGSTHQNGDTEGEASKDKKDALRKKFTTGIMGGLINGNIGKRARSHSTTLPSPMTQGKDTQISPTSSTDPTVSLEKYHKGSRGNSRTNSLTISPTSCHQIHSRLSNTLKLPAGPLLTSHHRLLKMKLAPLAAVESQLLYELSIPARDEVGTRSPWPLGRLGGHKELIVRPLRGWEEKFGRLRIGTPKWLKEEPKVRDPDDPSHIISAW